VEAKPEKFHDNFMTFASPTPELERKYGHLARSDERQMGGDIYRQEAGNQKRLGM